MHQTDFLIIGSGIAGLNFALNAAEKGTVLIVTKKQTAESNTNRAQGGIAAVLDRTDNVEKHIKDTLEAGSYHNKKKAVEFMIKHSTAAVHKLIERGVPFATSKEGKLLLTQEGGHSRRRIAFVGDYTGREIEKTLVKKTKAHPNITIWEHTLAVQLLVHNKTCYGAQILHKEPLKKVVSSRNCKSRHIFKRFHNNIAEEIFSCATVLATGGLGHVYKYSTNPKISTGDGLKLSYDAGCTFKDLEFIQFHPTALNLKGAPQFLISEAVRGEGALLKNHKKQRFMHHYHPRKELAPRDIVALAIYEEEKKGPVYLDITHKNPQETKIRFPQIYQKLLKYGLDLTHDLIPISPAAHYSCGGIKVNLRGETGIKNLYAFGEVVCTGVHGANRLASNSLLEALVFSEQIIKNRKNIILNDPQRYARQEVKGSSTLKDAQWILPKFSTLKLIKLTSQEKRKLQNIKREIQNLMWEHVGIVRTTNGLKKAISQLEALEIKLKTIGQPEKRISHVSGANSQSRFLYTNPLLHEVQSILCTAKLITRAAKKRKKSLGSHVIKEVTS